MKFIKGLIIFLIVVGVLIVAATPFIIYANKAGKLSNIQTRFFPLKDYIMTWGATIRPYTLGSDPQQSIDQQFKFITELFPKNVCVRANIEPDMAVNDMLVNAKEKYNTRLYLILEENIDFNQTQNYEEKAQLLADKIVSRYKGKVEYYQLMNEVTGVIFSKADDKGEKIDAGYGLTVDKVRYDNVLTYTKALSEAVRKADPHARIILTGNWVLIDPVLSLVKSGVDTDIIGWNWGSGLSDKPGIIDIDNYGTLDIPAKVKEMGKKFWLIEANRDDGSYKGKETEQAQYIQTLATAARDNTDVQGYFHFTLTDSTEEGAAGALGLIKIQKSGAGWAFDGKKPAFDTLKQVAAGQ